MSEQEKKLCNPFSTGGGGNNFEKEVHTSFVTLMLAGGFAPCLSPWPIIEVKLQGKRLKYNIDDSIIIAKSPDGKSTAKLLCQVKHSISITKKSKIFGEVIKAAWNDFNETSRFNKGVDAIALITGPLSKTDIDSVRTILEGARHKNSIEFFRDVRLAKFSSRAQRKKLDIIIGHIVNANNGKQPGEQKIWDFLRSFHLLGYDLDIKSGVTISLLKTLIGQYSMHNAHGLWASIYHEVGFYNQNGGSITVERLPPDIRLAFIKPTIEKIPEQFITTPTVNITADWNLNKLATAILLGGWDEKSQNDRQIIQQLTGESYRKWIVELRETLNQDNNPFSFKNGIWKVNDRQKLWQDLGSYLFNEHLDKFGQISVEVLKELDPQFELHPDERYMANIKGKVLQHSDTLRKGLAETLALLGNQADALRNCKRGKAETIAILSIKEILNDAEWILWGSLNQLLPTLAEAASEEFLEMVENALKKSPCPFDELYSQEGNALTGGNYMTGLLWALENLAWDPEHLVRVTIILGKLASRDPGGNWGNRPANSLTTIFLPWMPQTIASVEKRKVAVQKLLEEFPNVAWKLLLNLLPNACRSSSGSHKPEWRKIIPDDWEKGVTNKEYWEQAVNYSEMAVETAKKDTKKLKELVEHLRNLAEPSFCAFLEYLETEEIKTLSEEERTKLWDALNRIMIMQKWREGQKNTLSPEIIKRIEQVAESIRAKSPQYRYRHLFTDRNIELYEEKGNYKEQDKKLEDRRQDAIKEIHEQGGIEAVFQFIQEVDSPRRVGYSLGIVSKNKDIDKYILPVLLENENNRIKEFTELFVFAKNKSEGWEWVDKIDFNGWTKIQVGMFLSYLTSNKRTWDYATRILGKHEDEYWKRANVDPCDEESDWDYAIEKLIEYKRPNAAIACLNPTLRKQGKINKELAVRALLDAISAESELQELDAYHTIEVIKALQNDPDVNPDDLFSIEWGYLPLLTGPGSSGEAKILEQKLASEPDFFCELICRIYRSKKEPERKKESTEQEKTIASNAWHLFREWKRIPGMDSENHFSSEQFKGWLQKVKTKCGESGHFDVAMITLGEALIHSPSDPDGLWINKTVAEALDSEDAEKLRRGYYTGIINTRGVYCVDPTGKPEKEIAAKYRQQAEVVENAGFHRFAITLRDLAKDYEHQAQQIIDEHEQENL